MHKHYKPRNFFECRRFEPIAINPSNKIGLVNHNFELKWPGIHVLNIFYTNWSDVLNEKLKMTNYFWCRVFNSKSFMEKVNKLELYNKQNSQQFEKLYFMLQIVDLLKNIENLTSILGKSVN